MSVHPRRYPQAEKYDDENNLNYGYPMFYGVGGTVHAHTWHWKVDLDVVGVRNSFLVTDIKVRVKLQCCAPSVCVQCM